MWHKQMINDFMAINYSNKTSWHCLDLQNDLCVFKTVKNNRIIINFIMIFYFNYYWLKWLNLHQTN